MRVQLKSGSESRQRVPGSGPQFQLRLLDGFQAGKLAARFRAILERPRAELADELG